MPDNFDIVFLGGGPAGYQGAIRSAQLGQKVAVIEKRDLGGVCLNRGCIPTKTIKASVDLLTHARSAKSYGLEIGTANPDIAAIIARKEKVATLVRNGVAKLFQANRIKLFKGCGQMISPQDIRVVTEDNEIILHSSKIIITTGSRPLLPEPFKNDLTGVLSTDDILTMQSIPASIIIVGAGAIGVEMASIMAGLGSNVTLIEARSAILPREDAEMSAYLTRMLKRQKIKIITDVSVIEFKPGSPVQLTLSNGNILQAEGVLVAAGRVPNVENIGLKEAGLGDITGPIPVDQHMETCVPGIYAAGDVTGGWLLAHVAFAEGITAAENAAGINSVMDYRVVPRCTFSVPEFASVGLSEEEARGNLPVETFVFPLKSMGMALALGEWEGQIKLVVNAESGKVLGGHIIGAHASDLIAEIALAMRNDIPVRGIVDTIHTHPSMSEAVLEAAQAACGQAIHILPGKKV